MNFVYGLIWVFSGAGLFALVGWKFGDLKLSDLIVGAIAGPIIMGIWALIVISRDITIYHRNDKQ